MQLECLVRLCTYSHWLKHDAMLVRTLFVLGNVTASGGEVSNANRLDIANSDVLMPMSSSSTTAGSKQDAVSTQRIDGMRMICTIFCSRAKDLVQALQLPSDNDNDNNGNNGNNDNNDNNNDDDHTRQQRQERDLVPTREMEEVLVKAVRTLANLSLEPSLGTRLARDGAFVSALLSVLNATTNVSMPDRREHSSERSTREELMMNVVSSLSNISFYGGKSILAHGKDISRILVRLLTLGVSGSNGGNGGDNVAESKSNAHPSPLLDDDEDEFHSWLSLECARVYGNFSRTGELVVIVVVKSFVESGIRWRLIKF